MARSLAVLWVAACGGSGVAPAVVVPTDLSGTWEGSGADSQGAELLTWVLAQNGTSVTGTVTSRGVDPADGSCASCHKNKVGLVSGTVAGTTLILTMSFPAGGDVPTPICSVAIEATTSVVTLYRIVSAYSGADSCEGPFTDGAFIMNHQP